MQDFYGDTPFIISTNSKKEAKRAGKDRNFKAIRAVVIASVLLIALVAYLVYDKIFTVNVEGKTYYAVCFYEGTNRKDAEVVREGLIASGGSGYIVNEGKFLVYGAVYERETDAENVAKKQQNGAVVKTVSWDAFSVKCKDLDQAKILGESLTYFNDSIDVLVKLSLRLDSYEENEALVYLQIEEISSKFYKFSKLIEEERCAQFLESCYNLLENDFLNSNETAVKSRLKLVIHELIDFRINTDFSN